MESPKVSKCKNDIVSVYFHTLRHVFITAATSSSVSSLRAMSSTTPSISESGITLTCLPPENSTEHNRSKSHSLLFREQEVKTTFTSFVCGRRLGAPPAPPPEEQVDKSLGALQDALLWVLLFLLLLFLLLDLCGWIATDSHL